MPRQAAIASIEQVEELKAKHGDLLAVLASPKTARQAHEELLDLNPELTSNPSTTQAHITYLKGAGVVFRRQLGMRHIFCLDKEALDNHVKAQLRAIELNRSGHIIEALSEPATPTQLSELLGIKKASLSSALKRLSNLGLISREVSDSKVTYSAVLEEDRERKAA